MIKTLRYWLCAPSESNKFAKTKHREFWEYCMDRGVNAKEFRVAWCYAWAFFPSSLAIISVEDIYQVAVQHDIHGYLLKSNRRAE